MRSLRILTSLVLWTTLTPGGAHAGDPNDPLPLAVDFRKEIPKLVKDPAGVKAHGEALAEDTDAELADADAISAQLRTAVMAKARKVQRNAQLVTVLGGEPIFRLPHFTITMASLGLERTERMDDVNRRENEAIAKTHGRPDQLGAEGYSRWANSTQGKAFDAERERIKSWFKAAVDEERRKYREGDSEAARTLEMLRQETLEELRVISSFHRAVRAEQKRRRGEPPDPEPLWTDEEYEKLQELQKQRREAETEKQHQLMNVRAVAVRTEYEVRPNESAETLFQVFKGAAPYVLNLKAPKASQGLVLLDLAQPGEVSLPLSYEKAGTYVATLYVLDAHGESASADVTITVKGEPLPIPKEEEEPASKLKKDGAGGTGGGGDDAGGAGGGGSSAVLPVPIQGTFQAHIWGAHAQLSRWDQLSTKMQLRQWPVPITLTIEPDGRLKSTVRYELPASEMGTPSDTLMRNMFWKVSFDLEGVVDWKTGKTHISIKNGHDESGYEKDEPKTDDSGKQIGFIGHWRDFNKVDYSMALEGWSLPGPQAAAWLAGLQANAPVVQELRQFDLEDLGIPAVLISDAGVLAYRDRGFFAMSGFDGSPAADGVVPRRRTYSRAIHHTGYDGKNETEKDETAHYQSRADQDAKGGSGAWYLKLLGVADATASGPAGPSAPPKDDDLLAFGLWPTRPITLQAGATRSARAMGVLGKNVYDAVDFSEQATWTASPGLTLLGGGTFKAAAPGTYTITASFKGPSGPMTSTLTITVTP